MIGITIMLLGTNVALLAILYRIDRVLNTLEQMRQRERRLAVALRHVQWGNICSVSSMGIVGLCPLCDQTETRGHAPDCIVGIALDDASTIRPEASNA